MPRLNLSLKNSSSQKKEEFWKVLIVDDEISVHQMTKIIMENWAFMDRPIMLVNAYSEKEAREVLAAEEDLALVFMDVIMERDDSGFRLVEYIRHDLGNKFTRIVLRTGQPGTLSIREIVQKYDINDYREKTQLSVDVLYTITSSCIRAYSDLKKMEAGNNYLREFFDSCPSIISAGSPEKTGVLIMSSIKRILGLSGEIYLFRNTESLEDHESSMEITGLDTERNEGNNLTLNRLSSDIRFNVEKCLFNQENRKHGGAVYFFFRSGALVKNVLYLQDGELIDGQMRNSLYVFLRNTAPFLVRSNIQAAGKSDLRFIP